MTFLLKSLISEIISSAMEITASAESRSVPAVLPRQVFILFNFEKQRSCLVVVIGVVNSIFKSLIVSGNASRLSSSENNERNKSNNLLLLYKSCLGYKIMSSLLSFFGQVLDKP